MKILGIDYGEAKVGLALGDTATALALPYKVIKNRGDKNLIKELAEICLVNQIKKIVIGLPINDQAKNESQAVKVGEFIDSLKQTIKLPVVTQDERFTTQAAKKMTTAAAEDSVAAMLILQSYFDLYYGDSTDPRSVVKKN